MKMGLRLLLLLVLSGSLFLAGCSVRIYGVPKEEWHQMTPAEQQQAREAYQERRRLYEERRLYEAKQRAHEAELRAQQARDEASHRRARQEHVTAPARIHFTLEGGTVYVAGRHRPFQPVTVELRQGESKRLMLVTTGERKPYRVHLVCSYEEGKLWLSNGKSRVHAKPIVYDRRWHQGQRYQNLQVGGAVGLRAGILHVGSGPMPVAPSSRSTGIVRGEPGRGHDKSETTCRDERGRVIKPGHGDNCSAQDKAVQHGNHVPGSTSASSGNSHQTSRANSDDARVKSYRLFDKASGTAAGILGNDGKDQTGKKGAAHPQGNETSHLKKTQRQSIPSAEAKREVKAKREHQSPRGPEAATQASGEKNSDGRNQPEKKSPPHLQKSEASRDNNPQRQNVPPAVAKRGHTVTEKHQNVTGSAVAKQAPGETSQGGKNQAGKKDASHPQERAPSRDKTPQPQNVSPAEAKDKGKEKPLAGRSNTEACSGDSAGKKGERADCNDESVVGKANGKRD